MIKTPSTVMIGGAGIWTPGCTVIGGQQNIDQLIKSLFANSEVGFAYDPNDLTTLYQDAAGTIPVTGAGQPLGLMLDKSKGLALGIEKLSNNDFSNNGVGWVIAGGVPTYAGGVVTLTTQAGGTGEIYQDISVPVGRLVKITARAKYSNAQSFGLNVYDGGGYTNYKGVIVFGTSFEEKSGYFFSTTGSLRVRMRLGASTVAATGDVDYISVKEIQGNHAYQTTSAARPLFKTLPNRIEYDKVDDNIITNLSAQLTGCTVVRAVPNVGTQILTNQTIPTPYDDNTDHCGLIVINRALTATETSQITKLFNKAAGV